MAEGVVRRECPIRGKAGAFDGRRGLAVHIGARGAGIAGPGEVVVSGTLKDLVVGSGIPFTTAASIH